MKDFLFSGFYSAKIVVISLIAGSVIIGCSSQSHLAPVSSSAPIKSYRVTTHVVSPGETLYGIAWRYNLDFRALAVANSMSTSTPLRVGQRLSLDTTQVVKNSVQKTKPKAAKRAVVVKNETQQPKRLSTVSNKVVSSDWSWPLTSAPSNTLVTKSSLNKALDIRGRLGDSVIATAAGVVVYAGDGLRGYGNLVIVKHSDQWLSAYGNNRKIVVKEGQTIKAGQQLAELGVDETNNAVLHFEIRKNGAPIDPTSLILGK